MRVIAGSARRIMLTTPPGLATRPTTDRIKETLFNIISRDLADCRFLDLFAGSGAIGIEALSRGAGQAVFVEQDRAALSCIKENLKRTRLEGRAKILAMDAAGALPYLKEDGEPFGMIFMDPPYRTGWAQRILQFLADSPVCGGHTLVIAEEALETDFSFAGEYGFEVSREKKYGTSKHVFLMRK